MSPRLAFQSSGLKRDDIVKIVGKVMESHGRERMDEEQLDAGVELLSALFIEAGRDKSPILYTMFTILLYSVAEDEVLRGNSTTCGNCREKR